MSKNPHDDRHQHPGDHADSNEPTSDARPDAAAFALDALDSTEARTIAHQTSTDPELADELATYQETAAVLGQAVAPVQPSAELRSSLLSQIASLPQQGDAPATGQSGAAASTTAHGSLDTHNHRPAISTNVTPISRARSGRLRNSILAAAAAIALFLGGMGVNQLMVSDSQANQQAQALSTLLEADDLQGATAPLADGGSATVMWSPTHGRAAVAAADFGALPEGKVYELWFIGADGAVPAGTFTANDGVKMVLLDGEMSAGDAVGITIEPEGGSEQPTTDPLVVIQS